MPELQITNAALNLAMADALERADLRATERGRPVRQDQARQQPHADETSALQDGGRQAMAVVISPAQNEIGDFRYVARLDEAFRQLFDAQTETNLDDAVEQIIVNDALKLRFTNLVGSVDRLYKAILPDPRASAFAPRRKLLLVLDERGRKRTEEELAVFDILTTPPLDLTGKERAAIKAIARDLLAKLKRKQLVLDWQKRQQYQAGVRLAIWEMRDDLFQHIYDTYETADRNVYAAG